MAATTTAPSQPVNDDADAREAARQILGDAFGYFLGTTADWHQALAQAASVWATGTAPNVG